MVVLGERSIMVDCDVLQADGGTRTASICGGYVALHDALSRLVAKGELAEHPLIENCAAISVGIVGGRPLLDLPYVEDVEGRGRHERGDDRPAAASSRCRAPPRAWPFSRGELDELLDLAERRHHRDRRAPEPRPSPPPPDAAG